MPNVVIPNAVHIIGYDTKRKDGNVALTCEDGGQLRSFDIGRSYLISLFGLQNPTQKLLELVPHLPISAVIQTSGMQVVEMHIFESLQVAKDHVQTIACCTDADEEICEDQPTTSSHASTSKTSVASVKPATSVGAVTTPATAVSATPAPASAVAATGTPSATSATPVPATGTSTAPATDPPATDAPATGTTETTAETAPIVRNLRSIKKEHAVKGNKKGAKKQLDFSEDDQADPYSKLDLEACLKTLGEGHCDS